MEQTSKCPICQHEKASYIADHTNDRLIVDCPRCSKFVISRTAAEDRLYEELKKIPSGVANLSGLLRLNSELGKENPTLTSKNYEDLLEDRSIPKARDIDGKLQLLLSAIDRRTKHFGDQVKISYFDDYSLAFAENHEEFIELLKLLESSNYIEARWPTGAALIKLTAQGYSAFTKRKCEKQGFIAMWFSGYKEDESHTRYKTITKEDRDECREAIKAAFKETEFEPMVIDEKEHNEKICDEIEIEISRSKFLIADVTGCRGGVYYEAGLAKKEGMEVIWLCKKGFEKSDMHFDTNRYNHIIYEDYNELTKRLNKRIIATVK